MKLRTGIRKILAIAIVLLLFGGAARVAYAAELYLSPASGSYTVGSPFTVRLMLDSGTEQVNTVEAHLKFDPTLLRVEKVSKTGSVLNLFQTEPTSASEANASGVIDLAGGSTNGSFTGKNTILSVTFNPLKEGSASVSITSGMVISPPTFSDILGSTGSGTYTIAKGLKPPSPQPTKPSVDSEPLPSAPHVRSSAGDAGSWTNDPNVTFSWDVPKGVRAVKLLVDHSPLSVPGKEYRPPIAEKTVELDEDGTWYFHAMFENANGWGHVAHFEINVDTQPPENVTVSATGEESKITLTINADDALAGIDHYEITVDDDSPLLVSPDELLDGSYTLEDIEPGDHTVRVEAYDRAGNVASAETKVTVAAAAPIPSKPVPVEPVAAEQPGVNWMYILNIILVAAVAVLATVIVLERRAFAKEKDAIKRETNEILERSGIIFDALRSEVEAQVKTLSRKPILSETETEVLNKLTEALELSEELIDKEIDDVKELLS